MARPISTTNIDRLLELASQEIDTKPIKKKTNPEIDSFITELKIKPGKTKVPTSIIYYQYFLWKKTRLIQRTKFLSYFKTKFQKTRTDHGIGFLLDSKSFDLSPGSFFRARAFLRKQREENKKTD